MGSSLIISGLLPELVKLAVRHQIICKHEGIEWVMVQGYRTIEYQERIYAKGREKQPDGTWKVTNRYLVVTDAPPEKDPHCRRAAYDIAILVSGKISWNAIDLYKKVGEYGKEVGLVWGGDFKNLHDYGHFELKNWRELPAPLNGTGE